MQKPSTLPIYVTTHFLASTDSSFFNILVILKITLSWAALYSLARSHLVIYFFFFTISF